MTHTINITQKHVEKLSSFLSLLKLMGQKRAVLWLVTVTSHQQDCEVEFTCSPSVCVGYHWVLLTSSHSTKTCTLS